MKSRQQFSHDFTLNSTVHSHVMPKWRRCTVRNGYRIQLLAENLEENKLGFFRQRFTIRRRSDILNSLTTSAITTSRNFTPDPGVVRLYVNAGFFLTTVRQVTSPTWGLPHPCKQDLKCTNVVCIYPVILISFLSSYLLYKEQCVHYTQRRYFMRQMWGKSWLFLMLK